MLLCLFTATRAFIAGWRSRPQSCPELPQILLHLSAPPAYSKQEKLCHAALLGHCKQRLHTGTLNVQLRSHMPAQTAGALSKSTCVPLKLTELHRAPCPNTETVCEPITQSQLIQLKQVPPPLISQGPPGKIPIFSIHQANLDLLHSSIVDCDQCAFKDAHYKVFVPVK